MVMTKTFLLAGACLVLAGCGDRIRPPAPEELARFQAADQAHPMVDMDRVLQAKIVTGPYRAASGDVLHVEMPKFPEQPSAAPGTDSRQIYNCRLADDGTIVLPIVGPLAVRGKSLAEIEAAIGAKYYPQYVAAPLAVYVSVQEYRTERVSIVGAVTQPGIHALRHDQMSLVALLMQAGGIVGPGAAVIRINRPADAVEEGQKVRKEEDRNALPILAPASAGASSWQAMFEPEGPLRTTGWLRVEQENGRASVRKWLDIGNEPQRCEFLGALPAPLRSSGTRDLATKLAQLSMYLEETGVPSAKGQAAGAAAQHNDARLPALPGWRVQEGRFVAVAYNEAGDSDPPSRTVAARRSLGEGYAVGSARPGAPRIRDAKSRPQLPVRAPNASGSDSDLAARGDVSYAEATSEDVPAPGRFESRSARLPAQSLDAQERVAETAGIQTLVLPVRGLNIPFADVVLLEGDTVVVEPPREQSISVVGLVTRPGNMPYPPGARYTLLQAVAFAGGLDLVADPRYVSVYRLAPDGHVVSATFQLVNPHRQQQLTDTLALPLKPGDVVSVEHTPRTRTNVFLDRVFRISLGLYVQPERLWND
jgi:protein involved in polysaccharide export with SLBB domain